MTPSVFLNTNRTPTKAKQRARPTESRVAALRGGRGRGHPLPRELKLVVAPGKIHPARALQRAEAEYTLGTLDDERTSDLARSFGC